MLLCLHLNIRQMHTYYLIIVSEVHEFVSELTWQRTQISEWL
jgi:hypothetical protein